MWMLIRCWWCWYAIDDEYNVSLRQLVTVVLQIVYLQWPWSVPHCRLLAVSPVTSSTSPVSATFRRSSLLCQVLSAHCLVSLLPGLLAPRTGSRMVVCPDSFVGCGTIYMVCLFNFLPYFLPYLIVHSFLLIYFLTHLLLDLSAPSRIDPFHFQAIGRRRQPYLAFVFFVC